MLEQCYVTNSNLTEYSNELKQLLEQNMQLDDPELSVNADIVNSNLLEREIELQIDSNKPRTILLVGNIGAGKSTFIHRFIQQNAEANDLNIIVDLINRGTVIPNSDERNYVTKLILDQFSEEYRKQLDPYDRNILRSCFDAELYQFKNQRNDLATKKPDEYALIEEEYLQQLASNRDFYYKHLIGYIKLARKKKIKVWIAFDNVDRNVSQYQEFIYSFAHELAQTAKCVTVITLREDTFYEAKQSGFLDVRQTDKIFRVKAPEFKQVISKRRKYVDKLLDSGEIKKYKKLYYILNRHLNGLLLLDNRIIRDSIAFLSNNNLRTSFSLLRDYYSCSLSSFYKFYDEQKDLNEQEEAPDFNYNLELNTLIKVLMLLNRWSYQESESSIHNLFAVDASEKSSHFLIVRLLAYLELKRKSTLNNNRATYKQILKSFTSFGYKESHIEQSVQRLIISQLIVPSDPIRNSYQNNELNIEPKMRVQITPKGYYYFSTLLKNTYYLTRVGEDTVWYDYDLAQSYINLLKSADINEKEDESFDYLEVVNAKEVFLNYLTNQYVADLESGGLHFQNDEGVSINLHVEQNLFGKQITNSNSTK